MVLGGWMSGACGEGEPLGLCGASQKGLSRLWGWGRNR